MERAAVFVLLGVTELFGGREAIAREAFRQALGLDPSLTVDTLRELHSDLLRVFDAERERLPRVTLEAPVDTVVAAAGGRWRFAVHTTRRARVVIAIAEQAAPGSVVHQDSQIVTGVALFEWDLRRSDGRPLATAGYAFRITAQDDAGLSAPPVERRLSLDSVPVDTQPLPPPLPDTAFAPESALVKVRQPGALVRGLFFGVLTASLAAAAPGRQHTASQEAPMIVGAIVAIGGTTGFLKGRTAQRPIPENIRRNSELRDEDARARRAIAQVNARALENRWLRVRLTGGLR